MITVRKKQRKLAKSTALYLDYTLSGKRILEPTYLHTYPSNDEPTKQLNRENLIRFEILRSQRQTELLNGIVPLPVNRQNKDFFKYYVEYFKRFPTNERRAAAVLEKLKEFYPKSVLPVTHITEGFLLNFQTFLDKKCNLSGETPHNYFKQLCRVIKFATKERLFTTNPAADIKMKKRKGIPKNILTIDDIQTLYNSKCSNDAIKRGFLFCCFTGLRYCDVSKLTWKDIQDDKISIIQSKTGRVVNIDLQGNAGLFLGEQTEQSSPIFSLPTTLNGCNKVLKAWVKNCGINKKITWHCGRHSFATNLHLYGVDLETIADMLGHSSTKHTRIYAQTVEAMRRNAILKLPLLTQPISVDKSH